MVLLALAVTALAPALGMAQYTPKWHVGDWWEVRTEDRRFTNIVDISRMPRMRCEVTGIEKVHGRDCFVVAVQSPDQSTIAQGYKEAYYVRADSWLVVMCVTTSRYLARPDTVEGDLGLQAEVLELPRFPLHLVDVTDTAFRREYAGFARREMSGVADAALVNQLLADGDTAGIHVVRPAGVVYQVRKEVGSNLGDTPSPAQAIYQNLQLWCPDQPWRLYMQDAVWNGASFKRKVMTRSWLVAVGRREK